MHKAMDENKKRLEGKVAVITGAGDGIGKASARVFSENGARVVIADNDSEKGSLAAEEISSSGGEAVFLRTDVSSEQAVVELFRKTLDLYGGLHVLYNNAGVFLQGRDGKVEDIEEAAWDRIIGVNLKGTFLCCKHGMPALIRSGGGSVINTSSSAGVIGVPGCGAYSASKGGVISLTRAMAVEYAPRGVRVNCIVPCAVETPMNARSAGENPGFDEQAFFKAAPLGRYGTPEEIARFAMFLASDESSYAVGGVFVADGGITIRNMSY